MTTKIKKKSDTTTAAIIKLTAFIYIRVSTPSQEVDDPPVRR